MKLKKVSDLFVQLENGTEQSVVTFAGAQRSLWQQVLEEAKKNHEEASERKAEFAQLIDLAHRTIEALKPSENQGNSGRAQADDVLSRGGG